MGFHSDCVAVSGKKTGGNASNARLCGPDGASGWAGSLVSPDFEESKLACLHRDETGGRQAEPLQQARNLLRERGLAVPGFSGSQVMERGTSAAQLGLQLGASAALVALMTIVHGLGLVGIAEVLRLKKDRRSRPALVRTPHFRDLAGRCLLPDRGSHGDTRAGALSLGRAYATLGRTADYFPQAWRLIGPVEALVGFVLIGWSTAFVVSTMNRLRG